MENRIKFTKEQLQLAINDHLLEEKGLYYWNTIFSTIFPLECEIIK